MGTLVSWGAYGSPARPAQHALQPLTFVSWHKRLG